jgi:hypothetical protein
MTSRGTDVIVMSASSSRSTMGAVVEVEVLGITVSPDADTVESGEVSSVAGASVDATGAAETGALEPVGAIAGAVASEEHAAVTSSNATRHQVRTNDRNFIDHSPTSRHRGTVTPPGVVSRAAGSNGQRWDFGTGR